MGDISAIATDDDTIHLAFREALELGERIAAETAACDDPAGGAVANSHTTGVREVGIKRITSRDVDFKGVMDPHGLLNPGKLNLDGVKASALATSGWTFAVRA